MSGIANLWRYPDFRKLWSSQTLATLSSNVTNIAVPIIAALTLNASPFEMGLLSTMATLPNILVGLFVGPWIDRVRRQPVMVAAHLLRASLLITIPIASLLKVLAIWQLYIILFLFGILTTFFEVAAVAYLPVLVGRDNLMSANSKIVGAASVAQAIGPGLAGWLIHWFTAPLAILVDAFTLIISAGLIAAVKSPEPASETDHQQGGFIQTILTGLQPMYQNPLLRSIVISSMLYLFFSNMILAIYVLYATRTLGLGPAALGLIFGLGGAGAALGSVLVTWMGRHLGIGPTMIVANLIGGFSVLLVPLAGWMPIAALPLLAIAQFASQMMGAVFYINQTSLLQGITPDPLLGRVNASYRFLTMGCMPLGAFLGGVMGQVLGVVTTLMVGALGLLLPVLWLFLSPIRVLKSIDYV